MNRMNKVGIRGTISVAVCLLICGASGAQGADDRSRPGGLHATNTGEQAALNFTGHVINGQVTGQLSAEEVAEVRAAALAVEVSLPETEVETNSGRTMRLEHGGHQLTTGRGVTAGGILYAPSNGDTPAFRSALASATGLTVDYFDARADTPTLALLCTYDAVFTWANSAYADNVAFGDVLADYVDFCGGTVILGNWCLPTQTFWLEGRIMEPEYCPVSATDDTRETRAYAGDGADCVHVGPPFVGAYSTDFRDDCTLRSGAQSDGTYEDGFLSVAWRQDRKVYYSAGNTGTFYGAGEWSDLVANMVQCVRGGGVLYAPSNGDNPEFRQAVADCLGVPVDYWDARVDTPSLGLLQQYECVLTWANFAYDDKDAFGNVLADYADAGGRVVLGQWTYPSTQPNALGGRIITSDYCPITSSGVSTFTGATYNQDGVDCVHVGGTPVNDYDTSYLDQVELVAGALFDGTFDDAGTDRISVAWRPDRRVYYSAGNTGGTFGTGNWPALLCNICECFAGCGTPDAGSCCEANGTPGCDNDECCQAICDVDPYCCEVAWDSLCAEQANESLACLDCVCADETTAPTVALTNPPELGDGCVCDVTSIIGSAFDADGSFEGYRLDYRRVGDPAWTTIATGTEGVEDGVLAVWDTSAIPGGYYNLRLTARNICGLSATAVLTVFVDKGYDTVRIDYPEDGQIIGRNVCIEGTVFESWCGSSYVVEYRPASGGPWLPVDPDEPGYNGTVVNELIASWSTNGLGLADGDYLLRVTAFNDCQQMGSDTIMVTVDNTSPLSEITAPVNCENVAGLVEVYGTAFDENIRAWSLQYTGGDTNQWVTIASGDTNVVEGLLHVWDTTDLPACAYTLRLVVTDLATLGCRSGSHRTDFHTSITVGLGGGAFIPGDANCDGVVNGFDIDPFVHCLTTGDCDCPE